MPEVAEKPVPVQAAADPESLSWSGPGSATALPMPTKAVAGWLPVHQLEEADVYMYAGPTGRSAYWPEWFAFVHPDCATTDTALNRVDEVWFGDPHQEIELVVFLEELSVPALSEAVREIREVLDLPAAQIAAMCGVSRRQLYNLMEGRPASFGRERWIRSLYDVVTRLNELVGGNREQLRAAVLLPIDGGRSLFTIAEANDAAALGSAADILQRRVLAGFQGRVRRPIPLKKAQDRRNEASDFLTDYSGRGS